jgi:putative sterol carrier protein
MTAALVHPNVVRLVGERAAGKPAFGHGFRFVLGPANTLLMEGTGDCVVLHEATGDAGVTVPADEADFLALLAGRMSPHAALFTRRIRFTGNPGLVMQVGDLLPC